MKPIALLCFCCAFVALGCEEVEHKAEQNNEVDLPAVTLDDVARLLSGLPLGQSQLQEVHDAVNSSSVNGYDEEYTMRNLFAQPGSGVGDELTKSSAKDYEKPLRDLIAESLRATKSGDGYTPEDYIKALSESDVQVYWPYSEDWNGEAFPVITFDPADGSDANIGYRLIRSDSGLRVEEIIVDESFAKENPVWVVNRNNDAHFSSLELQRRADPQWGLGGGSLTTKAGEFKTLYMKDFTAKRNYDPWFAGASEFFIKCGSIDGFKGTSEADLKQYSPSVTDFMIVVKRSQIGQKIPFNVVLVSEWSPQLENCAFMIHEDDGGSMTSWKCEATVKLKSKSYGVEIQIPLNSRDDIVWRGKLSANYFERYSAVPGHFGDVEMTFEVVER